ncbi:horcolin-like [Lolium perenne]|uniref:horcolin-like n=1 Tax=Lolium perenne TaxID=4522 RepID=UPI0021F51F3C|nr:jacalin-related lectin 3-like [Lolium perenne]
MEKTVAKTIVKADPQRHLCVSTSATAELIAVDNPEAFSCPKCLQRLKPPVFQCGAGHLVCSSCHDELQQKNKCASCFFKTEYTRFFLPTEYTRCNAVERILQSISVANPSAITGVKMICHEKEEPEKRQGGLVKMGPCGGGGGGSWKTDVCGINRIVKLRVRHGGAVDALQVLHERHGLKEWTKKWGGAGGKRSEICLEPEEYLTCVKGHIGHYDGWFIVKSLTFVTNLRTFGRYGKAEGLPFQLPAAGGRIVGFHGRSGSLLDSLGTYVRMDA